MPVWRWHGDVPASHKAKLVAEPSGVLLITPESLESLFVNRSKHLPRLFGGLRFVVIDEMHSFLDSERGLHLRSLLARLRQVIAELTKGQAGYRTVALSATIGDFSAAQRFISPDAPDSVDLIREPSGGKELRYRIHGYRVPPQVDGPPRADDEPDPVSPHRLAMARDIVEHCRGRANLVFANSRADVEEFADLCRQQAEQEKLPDQILVHHGSLSAEIREDTEATMKSKAIATTFCSPTLELGIDIGSVAMVGQIGPPWSVSAMLQRMGRSGRKDGQPRVMRGYIECDEPDARADIFDRLQLRLVQAVALSELMLVDRWLEPACPPAFDLSTLTHQIISVISETSGLRADALYDRLCRRGAFREIEPPLFAALLRCLGQADVVEQMATGDLILGLRGEGLRKKNDFYAVFATPDEFAVIHQGQVLGRLELVPKLNDFILLAGRRWQIVDIDEDKREVQVLPTGRRRRTKFSGGRGEVNAKVRQKMREVLLTDRPYAYLDTEAATLLADARKAAGSCVICHEDLVNLSDRRTAFMTWTGSRTQETLQAMFRLMDVVTDDEGIGLVFHLSVEDTEQALAEAANQVFDPAAIAGTMELRRRRKYDWLLSDELIDTSLARGWLDIAGAGDLIKPFRTKRRLVHLGAQPADLTTDPPSPSTLSDLGEKEFARPCNPVQLVTTQQAFEQLCRQLATEPVLGLDVETTIFQQPRLLCTIQLATPGQNWVIDALALRDLSPIGPLLMSPSVVKVIHNASFEEAVFAENGLSIENVFDTCQASRCCRPDADSHRLDQVAVRELGLRMDKTCQKADWRKRPLTETMIAYAALDAELMPALYAKLRGEA